MRVLKSKRFWIIMLMAVALMIGVCSVVAVNATEKTVKSSSAAASAFKTTDSSRLYTQINSAMHNRSRWLYDLMSISGKAEPTDASNPEKIFAQARACGIVDDSVEQDMYLPLNRRFVARTMVKALGYKRRSIGYLADVVAADGDMATMAYYGYFLPDVNSMVHPDAEITDKEYDSLLSQLNAYRLLKGKTLLSFGDSIMYGTGNSGNGIADMFGEKYGMKVHDYAVPGSTMGYRENRGHIRDQVVRAIKDRIHPDLIFLNGATNDMYHLPLGNFTSGFDMSKAPEATFTEGMEKTLWSLRQNWRSVPVVYMRMHNMDLGDDKKEREFGERSLAIAEKWSLTAVDLYNGTDMNTELPETCNRYTYFETDNGFLCDSIHPNALGYAKFYLPSVTEAVTNLFNKE